MSDSCGPSPSDRRNRRIVKAYNYTDQDGHLLFQNVRYEPKSFSQRRPNPNGKAQWIWNLGGVRRVLYNLPALHKAATVFVAEGEKDADTLTGLGLVATTNPCGAHTKWRNEYTEHLNGKHVIIVQDNDDPGRKHAQDVARNLHGAAASVKVVAPPEGKDVTEWLELETGGLTTEQTKEQFKAKLRALVEGAAEYDPGSAEKEKEKAAVRRAKVVCLADVAAVPVEWLWEPYLPLGKLTMLEGDPAVGKSFFAMTLATIISRGWAFPGKDGVPNREQARPPASVVYLSAEDSLADTVRARLDAAEADCARIHAITGIELQRTAGGEVREAAITLADLDVLGAVLEEVRPSLVVIDPIQAYIGAGVDMHRTNEVRPVLAALARLAEAHRCTMIVVRHLTKGQADKSMYRGQGSIDFTAAARSVLLAGRDPKNPTQRVLAHLKCSNALEGPSLGYEIREGKFHWTGLSDLTVETLLAPDSGGEDGEKATLLREAEGVLREILSKGPVLALEVVEEVAKAGISRATFRRAKATLKIKSERRGGIGGEGQWWMSLPDNVRSAEKETF